MSDLTVEKDGSIPDVLVIGMITMIYIGKPLMMDGSIDIEITQSSLYIILMFLTEFLLLLVKTMKPVKLVIN